MKGEGGMTYEDELVKETTDFIRKRLKEVKNGIYPIDSGLLRVSF